MLYYYRKQLSRPSVSLLKLHIKHKIYAPIHVINSQYLSETFQGSGAQRSNSTEPGPGLLSRWLSSHYHGGVHDVARHTVNLLTSTIKRDAEQSDLRFCFRIISPTKIYTLQVSLLSF